MEAGPGLEGVCTRWDPTVKRSGHLPPSLIQKLSPIVNEHFFSFKEIPMEEATILKGSMPSSRQLTKHKINDIFGGSLCQGFILLFFCFSFNIILFTFYFFLGLYIFWIVFCLFSLKVIWIFKYIMTSSLVYGIPSIQTIVSPSLYISFVPFLGFFYACLFVVPYFDVLVFDLSYIVFYCPLKIYLFSNERQKSRWKERLGGLGRHRERRNCNKDII